MIDASERYKVVAELGRGGMGVVYRAHDVATGRDVALKVITNRLSERHRKRFEREGEITARLDHPGIVRVHSSGLHSGRPYLAYELVEGVGLEEAMRGADVRRRVELIRDAARALGYAHRQGVVHRDVKAENVLVDRSGHVRVADFGLASATDLERMTQTGATLGTPSHMSPEQVGRSGAQAPGPPSDVWSLGVMLYLALTEELPFTGDTMVELAGKILTTAPVRPSKHDAAVPRALDAVCLRALRREPEDRYPDGGAFADDLQAWLDGTWSGRRGSRRLLVAALVVLAVLVAGAVVSALTRDAPSPESVAVMTPREEAPPRRPRSPDAVIQSARRELASLGDFEPPLRVKTVDRWLAKHPDLPAEDLAWAKELRRQAQLEFPVRAWRHTPREDVQVRGALLGDDRVVTHGSDLQLRCWDLEKPDAPPLWELTYGERGPKGEVPQGDVATSPDGEWVVVGYSSELLIADRDGGRRRRISNGEAGQVRDVEFSPDGRTLLAGAYYEGVHVYAWPSLEHLEFVDRSFTRAVGVSRDGKRAAAVGGPWTGSGSNGSGGEGCFLLVWDLVSGERLIDEGAKSPLCSVALAPDGRSVVCGDTLGNLYAVRVEAPTEWLLFEGVIRSSQSTMASGRSHVGEIRGIAFGASGHVFSVTHTLQTVPDGVAELRVWEYPSREEVRRANRPVSFLSCQAIGDGKQVICGTKGGSLDVYLADPR